VIEKRLLQPSEGCSLLSQTHVYGGNQERRIACFLGPGAAPKDSLPAESYFSLQVTLQMGLSCNQGFSITFQAVDH
jgi:hypothetical protein